MAALLANSTVLVDRPTDAAVSQIASLCVPGDVNALTLTDGFDISTFLLFFVIDISAV
jgi:hypothetical protein